MWCMQLHLQALARLVEACQDSSNRCAPACLEEMTSLCVSALIVAFLSHKRCLTVLFDVSSYTLCIPFRLKVSSIGMLHQC